MKVVFMGTPAFSVPVLEAVAARHEIVAVYCQPPRPAGRGKKLRASPVQERAEALGLQVLYPTSLKGANEQAAFRALGADVAVVVAYGLLLPQAVLDAPRYGCLNIHASLLPRWRGAAPIQRAILAGDTETGVCIMQMEAGLDTGPVLLRSTTPLGPDDTAATVQARLAAIGAALIVQALEQLPELVPTAQPAEGMSYASKIDKAEARIDWAQSAEAVDRQIRAFSPFPGAYCDVAGERVKLLRSRVIAGRGAPGEVLEGFRIACGLGAIEVLEAQREGKRPMQASELLKGLQLPKTLG